MKKSVPVTNHFCPQTLFLYGTNREDGAPNFGLFCWFSYYWDGGLGVMCCIGGDKLTKDRIRSAKVFSANLVTEELLPLADYFGNKEGYADGKMNVAFETEKGHVLDVPMLARSPVVYELEVDRSIALDDGEVFLCKIRNVLHDESLCDDSLSYAERVQAIRPFILRAGRIFRGVGIGSVCGGSLRKPSKRDGVGGVRQSLSWQVGIAFLPNPPPSLAGTSWDPGRKMLSVLPQYGRENESSNEPGYTS